MIVLVVNKVQSLNLFAYCFLPQKEIILSDSCSASLASTVCSMWTLNWSSPPSPACSVLSAPCTSVIATALHVLLSVPQKTLMHVQINMENGKDASAIKIKAFRGCITSWMTVTKNWIAAGSHINTQWSRDSSIFPHPFFQPVALWNHRHFAQWICRLQDEWLNHLLYLTRDG